MFKLSTFTLITLFVVPTAYGAAPSQRETKEFEEKRAASQLTLREKANLGKKFQKLGPQASGLIASFLGDGDYALDSTLTTDEAIQSIALSSQNLVAAATYAPGKILLWNTVANKTELLLGAGIGGDWKAYNTLIDCNPPGTILACCLSHWSTDSSLLQVWDISKTPADFRYRRKVPAEVSSCVFSPDGSSIALGCQKGNINATSYANHIELWSITQDDANHIRNIDLGNSPLADRYPVFAFNHDGTRIAYRTEDSVIQTQDIKTKRLLQTLKSALSQEEPKFIESITFNDAGKFIAASYNDRTIEAWDERSGKSLFHFKAASDATNPYKCMSIAAGPQKDLLALALPDGAVQIWNVNNPKKPTLVSTMEALPAKEIESRTLFIDLYKYPGHVAWRSDWNFLAIGRDHTLQLWRKQLPLMQAVKSADRLEETVLKNKIRKAIRAGQDRNDTSTELHKLANQDNALFEQIQIAEVHAAPRITEELNTLLRSPQLSPVQSKRLEALATTYPYLYGTAQEQFVAQKASAPRSKGEMLALLYPQQLSAEQSKHLKRLAAAYPELYKESQRQMSALLSSAEQSKGKLITILVQTERIAPDGHARYKGVVLIGRSSLTFDELMNLSEADNVLTALQLKRDSLPLPDVRDNLGTSITDDEGLRAAIKAGRPIMVRYIFYS